MECLGMPVLGENFFLAEGDTVCFEKGKAYIYRPNSVGPVVATGIDEQSFHVFLVPMLKKAHPQWGGKVSSVSNNNR